MFKRAVRQVALKHGIHATFMAKPYQGQPGSSMHIHQNLVCTKKDKNLFSDEGGNNTKEFLHPYPLGGPIWTLNLGLTLR